MAEQNISPVAKGETYQDTGFSWRRLRALCHKETRQILRDPSSGLIAVVIPLMLLFILAMVLTLIPANCMWAFYWSSRVNRRKIWLTPSLIRLILPRKSVMTAKH